MTIAGRPSAGGWRGNRYGPEKGSIILILATDAPLDARQLGRLSLRAGAGLARTGSVFGHGSGDISLAFPRPIPCRTRPSAPCRRSPCCTKRGSIDFRGRRRGLRAGHCQRAVARPDRAGRDGHVRRALVEVIPDWRQWLADRDF